VTRVRWGARLASDSRAVGRFAGGASLHDRVNALARASTLWKRSSGRSAMACSRTPQTPGGTSLRRRATLTAIIVSPGEVGVASSSVSNAASENTSVATVGGAPRATSGAGVMSARGAAGDEVGGRVEPGREAEVEQGARGAADGAREHDDGAGGEGAVEHGQRGGVGGGERGGDAVEELPDEREVEELAAGAGLVETGADGVAENVVGGDERTPGMDALVDHGGDHRVPQRADGAEHLEGVRGDVIAIDGSQELELDRGALAAQVAGAPGLAEAAVGHQLGDGVAVGDEGVGGEWWHQSGSRRG
jgi:hypothetical protein